MNHKIKLSEDIHLNDMIAYWTWIFKNNILSVYTRKSPIPEGVEIVHKIGMFDSKMVLTDNPMKARCYFHIVHDKKDRMKVYQAWRDIPRGRMKGRKLSQDEKDDRKSTKVRRVYEKMKYDYTIGKIEAEELDEYYEKNKEWLE